ncbi:hypothetical protein [Anaerocolumna sp.]|uniref:hypothetical protein n=1 Tax=Anaerocolumna sp. TaxID=2041569 RepID=UPI0028AB4200|nr:hypothetical protein [Anaerocolumna sp.]
MGYFEEISTVEEQENINGGGVISGIAGGMAGAMIGTFVGLIPAAVTGDTKYIKQSVVACSTAVAAVSVLAPVP